MSVFPVTVSKAASLCGNLEPTEDREVHLEERSSDSKGTPTRFSFVPKRRIAGNVI